MNRSKPDTRSADHLTFFRQLGLVMKRKSMRMIFSVYLHFARNMTYWHIIEVTTIQLHEYRLTLQQSVVGTGSPLFGTALLTVKIHPPSKPHMMHGYLLKALLYNHKLHNKDSVHTTNIKSSVQSSDTYRAQQKGAIPPFFPFFFERGIW